MDSSPDQHLGDEPDDLPPPGGGPTAGGGPAASLPGSSEWANVGPDLGGVLAEAAGAFAVWLTTPAATGEVSWPSGRGHDVVATVDGAEHRIDVKRAWRAGAPAGFFFCAPLSAVFAAADRTSVDDFALVLLDRADVSWTFDRTAAGEVTLQARARPAEVYRVPLADARRLAASGDIGRDGSAVARWKVREAAVASYRIPP